MLYKPKTSLYVCKRVSAKVAHNEQGFAMLGNLKNVRPEPMPNLKTDDEDNNKKPN
jgi:hypothetical protein